MVLALAVPTASIADTREVPVLTGRVRVVEIKVTCSGLGCLLFANTRKGQVLHPKCRPNEQVDVSVETDYDRQIQYDSVGGTRHRRRTETTTDVRCRNN